MYEWSSEHLMVQAAAREFIDAEVRPHVDALESGDLEPYPILRKMFATFGIDAMARDAVEKMLAKQEQREAAAATGKEPPAPQNGSKSRGGDSMATQAAMGVMLLKELTKVSMGLCGIIGATLGLGAAAIMARGTLAQKKRWLPELVTLEKIAAWALTEPDAGSDAFGGMKTHVVRDGGEYLLNGQKTFISNGPIADVIVVYAKLDERDGADKRNRKVLTFVLDKDMEGLTQGKPFKKMGLNSSPTGELFFDNVRIGKDRLLGETEDHHQGDGRDSARSTFVYERIGIAVAALGVIEECLRLSLDYAKNRKLWDKPISEFQLIQLKLAKMELARLNVQNMVFRTLEMLEAGRTPTLAESSVVKWYSSEAATDVAMEAVQLFGGNGYMREYRVEQLAREAKSLMIYAGTNEIQITHVAKGLLRG